MNELIKEYIEKNIFPKYAKYYSHGMIHINNVIKNTMFLADYYNLDKDMCYVMASYHDIGLQINRENHEKESARLFLEDSKMKQFFNEEQLLIIKEAIEDHRGSKKESPRSIYGCVLSDSDRDFDIKLLAKRQLATSLKHYPEFKTFEEHFENCYEYICRRINNNGNFNLWTNNPIMIERRNKFQEDYLNKNYAKSIYKKEWDKISKDGTKEKIIEYYEDY